ncbi:hypothetical protein [Leucobacter sp. GX24907]
MPITLPDPPRIDRWPPAVRSVELARGTILRCGPGLRPTGWPEHPRVRAAALAPWLEDGCIAIEMTAAWVWGVCEWSDEFLRLSLGTSRRTGLRCAPAATMRRLSFADDDTTAFQGLRVTTPLRTVFDLVHRSTPLEDAESTACQMLLGSIRNSPECVLDMCADRGYPGRNRAMARIRGWAGVSN